MEAAGRTPFDDARARPGGASPAQVNTVRNAAIDGMKK
jgi:hypothetical protein